MKYLLVIATILFLSPQLYAQVERKTFPDMEAETIGDEVLTLPEDIRGKITLVGLAFSKKSEKDLNTWLSPVYNAFLRQKSSNAPSLFASAAYDVNVYFIPMFTGLKVVAAGMAKNKAVENIDKLLHPYILFYKGKLKPYRKALDLSEKNVPYFFVIDEQGEIIYATSGRCNDGKMAHIQNLVDNQSKGTSR